MHTFQEAARLAPDQVGTEAARLATAPDAAAPGFVLGAQFEEDFYRTNNLPEQLRTLFHPINPNRIDEDALEVLCARAESLVRSSYLLDDAVQLFYRALASTRLTQGTAHVRRDAGAHTHVVTVTPPGQQVLVAVKKLWAHDWTFDAVLERLDTTGSVALEARPILVFAGPPGTPDPAVARAYGWPRALVNEHGIVGA